MQLAGDNKLCVNHISSYYKVLITHFNYALNYFRILCIVQTVNVTIEISQDSPPESIVRTTDLNKTSLISTLTHQSEMFSNTAVELNLYGGTVAILLFAAVSRMTYFLLLSICQIKFQLCICCSGFMYWLSWLIFIIPKLYLSF